MASVLLQLQSVSKAFGADEILNNVSLQVANGTVFGLIGPNGAGKTTLFNIIIGREHADSGDVIIPKNVKVAALSQDSEITGTTLLETLINSRTDIKDLSAQIHALENKISHAHHDDPEFNSLLEELSKLSEEYHLIGGDRIKDEAIRIIRGLSLDASADNKLVSELSGGQKRRLELAKVLLQDADLLLLDEPTNHLDLEAIDWLKDYLNAFLGGVLMVSHDRYLLDAVCSHIAEIEDTSMRQFDGNFTLYHKKKQAENEAILKRIDTIDKEKERLRSSIQTLFSHRKFTRMRSLEKQLYRLEELTMPSIAASSKMVFKPKQQSHKQVITVDNIKKSFDREIFSNLNFTVWRNEKIAVVGKNGAGKTTAIRCIVGEIPQDNGDITIGGNTDIYYYDQEGLTLDMSRTVFEEAQSVNLNRQPSEIRSALAQFLLFEGDVIRPVSTLSGGERSRVSLAKMLLSGANTLILDEPTNHLDIEGKEALERALVGFLGTVLMVSHDRYFIDMVANKVIDIENGKATEYHGNYTDFVNKKGQIKGSKIQLKSEIKEQVKKEDDKPVKKRSMYYLERKIKEVEEEIARLEEKLPLIEKLLNDPNLYLDHVRAKDVQDELDSLKEKLQQKYLKWDDLQSQMLL